MKNEARELFALFYSLLPSGAEMTEDRERVAKEMIARSETVGCFRELQTHFKSSHEYARVLAERLLERVDAQVQRYEQPEPEDVPREPFDYRTELGLDDAALDRERGKRRKKLGAATTKRKGPKRARVPQHPKRHAS